jgi:hypothetical protein
MIELLITAIPIEEFDQRKLETLLRRIPEAFVKAEALENGVEKRLYAFPSRKDSEFKIECVADHYVGAAIPSKTACSVKIFKDIDVRYDEHLLVVKDSEVVSALYKAISYSQREKDFFSSERVYGLGINGKYQKNFRFRFKCTEEKCRLTFSSKLARD